MFGALLYCNASAYKIITKTTYLADENEDKNLSPDSLIYVLLCPRKTIGSLNTFAMCKAVIAVIKCYFCRRHFCVNDKPCNALVKVNL